MQTIRSRAVALAREGMRPVEIAVALGVCPQTVNVVLSKARRSGVPMPSFPRGPVPAARPEKPPTMAARALAAAREQPTPSLAEIAARLGTSKASVTEMLRKARGRGETVPEFGGGRPRRQEEPSPALLVVELARQGLLPWEIAARLGLPRRRVYRILNAARRRGDDPPVPTVGRPRIR